MIPGSAHEELVVPITEEHPRNSEAAVEKLQDGRLLLVWSDFYGGESDWSAAQVAGRISGDRGRTWGEPFVVQENAGDMCTYSPSLLRMQSGNLGLTYFLKNSNADNRVYWRRSKDDGITWEAPVVVTPELGYHIINNDRTVQLRTGRIIAPIAYVPEYFDKTTSFRIFCAYSDDEGETWRRERGEFGLPKRGAMEPAVVEKKDGSLLMLVRTQLGHQFQCISKDGGETWDEPVPAVDLISSEAPASMKRIPKTGDLLVLWNRVFTPHAVHFGRSPLNSAVSRDDGGMWENVRTLETDPGCSFSYVSITFLKDEVLLTYFVSTAGKADRGLKLVILPVEWFYQE